MSCSALNRRVAPTTEPVMKDTNLTGADDYMCGLIKFAQAVVPSSAREIASVGSERNALLTGKPGVEELVIGEKPLLSRPSL